MTGVNGDLSGLYHEVKGDICTVTHRGRNNYHVKCHMGFERHRVEPGTILFWIKRGAYWKVRDLNDDEKQAQSYVPPALH